MTDRPTATGCEGSGAADSPRPDDPPSSPASSAGHRRPRRGPPGRYRGCLRTDHGRRHRGTAQLEADGCSPSPPSRDRASSSWSATTTPAASPPTPRPARTTTPRLLWTLLLLIPVLIVNQEMVVRLGAVTGVGHARLINERFGSGWGWFSVGDLFLLNFLTIVTEFIGISLAALVRRSLRVLRRSDCRGGAGGHHGHGQLPTLGAGHVRLHRHQPDSDPDVLPL